MGEKKGTPAKIINVYLKYEPLSINTPGISTETITEGRDEDEIITREKFFRVLEKVSTPSQPDQEKTETTAVVKRDNPFSVAFG